MSSLRDVPFSARSVEVESADTADPSELQASLFDDRCMIDDVTPSQSSVSRGYFTLQLLLSLLVVGRQLPLPSARRRAGSFIGIPNKLASR